MAERCAVVGIGQTKLAKCRDDVSLGGLCREAARTRARRRGDDVEGRRSRRHRHRARHLRGRDDAGAVPRRRARRGGQADHAGAHRGQRRRLDRSRRDAPDRVGRARARAHARVREAVGGRHQLRVLGRPQRRRGRGWLLRPAHPCVHRTLGCARLRRADGRGEGPPERVEEPVRAPADPRHLDRDGARVAVRVGTDPPAGVVSRRPTARARWC